MYDLRPRRTVPQALLLVGVVLLTVLMAYNVILLTLCPQYVSFGAQTYTRPNSTDVVRCTVYDHPSQCQMTQVAFFVNRMGVKLSLFGTLLYWGTWLILGMTILGTILGLSKGKASRLELGSDSEDDKNDLI